MAYKMGYKLQYKNFFVAQKGPEPFAHFRCPFSLPIGQVTSLQEFMELGFCIAWG